LPVLGHLFSQALLVVALQGIHALTLIFIESFLTMTIFSFALDVFLLVGSVAAGYGLGLTAQCFATTTIADVLRLHFK
jgi:hypothetical protein